MSRPVPRARFDTRGATFYMSISFPCAGPAVPRSTSRDTTRYKLPHIIIIDRRSGTLVRKFLHLNVFGFDRFFHSTVTAAKRRRHYLLNIMKEADRYLIIALVVLLCFTGPIFFGAFKNRRPVHWRGGQLDVIGFLVTPPFVAPPSTTHRQYGVHVDNASFHKWMLPLERFRDNGTLALAAEFQAIVKKLNVPCESPGGSLFRAELGASPCRVSDVMSCLSDSNKDAHCFAFIEALFNAWVSEKMACRDCASCRSLIVEFRTCGIGSQINSLVQLLGTALDTSRQFVFHGSWDFANKRTCPPGKDNWLCIFEPISACEVEPQSNTRVAATYAELGSFSGEHHVLVPRSVNIPSFQPRIFHRLRRVFNASHSFVWGLFLKRLMRFNSQHVPFILDQISDAFGPRLGTKSKLNAGLHIRGAEFNQDGRKAISISEYFTWLDDQTRNGTLNTVYIATDWPHVTGAFLHLARPSLSRHRLFMHQRAKLPVGVPVSELIRDPKLLAGFDVNELALEVLSDMMILSHSDFFLGTCSNWLFVVPSLMAPTIPQHRKCALMLDSGDFDNHFANLTTICDGDAHYVSLWDKIFFGPPE